VRVPPATHLFFTSDLEAVPGDVASNCAGRWSIECVDRDLDQCLGAGDPQCWKGWGEREKSSTDYSTP
jgi:hypothetical protein